MLRPRTVPSWREKGLGLLGGAPRPRGSGRRHVRSTIDCSWRSHSSGSGVRICEFCVAKKTTKSH